VRFLWTLAGWGRSFFLRIILWACWWLVCRNWESCRLSCARRAILCACSWSWEKILAGCWVGSYSIESTFYFLFFTYLNMHGKLQKNSSHNNRSKQNIQWSVYDNLWIDVIEKRILINLDGFLVPFVLFYLLTVLLFNVFVDIKFDVNDKIPIENAIL
jgi:hypothetical protein